MKAAKQSITNFFDRVEKLVDNHYVANDSYIDLFKTICVYDYMHARCDWDYFVDDKTGEGKESFARDLTNYIMDKENPFFYCEECDDYCSDYECEHEKTDQSELLENVLRVCESSYAEKYDFSFPDNAGPYLMDRTKKLFNNRQMNYGMFLDMIFSEYNDAVTHMCC